MHPSEEQFVFFYYGDAEDREALERHLASCDSCRSAYRSIESTLAAVESPVPERPENYGEHLWARIEQRIGEPAGFRWAQLFSPRRWALAGAMAGLIVVAFLAGRYSSPRQAPQVAAISESVRQRILLLAVGDHLDRSQMVLIELEKADGSGPVDISAEQRLARDLISSNRIYRQTATRDGDKEVANVLDDLERVLVEIAHSPSDVTPAELDAIRQRIESQGILFKVRVIDSEVREREKAIMPETPQGRT